MSCKLSKNKARKAGEVLACEDASEEEKREAIAVVNQWREAHRELFCTIPTELKAIAYAVDPDAIVVARIKRIDTIVGKLRRPGLNMKLNEMFDIVGCRIITKDIHSARQISNQVEKQLSVKAGTGIKDYIAYPKRNGYRSTHIISRHDAPEAGLSNLFCETQIRTQLQHAWATALETYDVATKGSLKFGSGSKSEERLFALISNAFAFKEQASLVPETPQDTTTLRSEILRLNKKLFAIEKLRACADSVTVVSKEGQLSGDALCLLVIDYALQKTDLYVYDTAEETLANRMYAEREHSKKGLQDVLLVRVSSMQNLREAYPNYSTDIARFLDELDLFLQYDA